MSSTNTSKDNSYTHIDKAITISYVVIQLAVAILVSILGAYYVYQQRKYENQVMEQTASVEIQPMNVTNTENAKITETNDTPNNQCTKFVELWAKTMWKMRSVYSALAVHCFDVLTDILVIIEWLNTPNTSGDHIDPQLMAYSGIAIIIFSKLFSSIAIFIKERNIIRTILQFFDILIFQEIFDGHKKIKIKLKQLPFNQKKSDQAIEATLSFKYIRQMEAVFESVPQSILQLVYVMRTGSVGAIFVISILQSIISMANSNLNHDYTRMLDPKYKKYKEKFPPTMQFVKHSMCRLAEITHRIGLLSLVWSVCGGHIFSIVLGVEFLVKFISTEFLFQAGEIPENMDSVLLAVTALVIVPCEEMYSIPILNLLKNDHCMTWTWFLYAWMIGTCGGCFVLITIALSSVLTICTCVVLPPLCFTPLIRMHLSLVEFILVILYGILGEDGERESFLLSSKHGLGIFIVTCIFYVIWTQYLWLFPNVTLPLNIAVRSKWGYAYGNELSELKKLKWDSKRVLNAFKNKSQIFLQAWQSESDFYKHGNQNQNIDTSIELQQLKLRDEFFESWKTTVDMNELLKEFYWDEPFRNSDVTPTTFALANENYEIVQWLEGMGAVFHKGMSSGDARAIITKKNQDLKKRNRGEIAVRQTNVKIIRAIEESDQYSTSYGRNQKNEPCCSNDVLST